MRHASIRLTVYISEFSSQQSSYVKWFQIQMGDVHESCLNEWLARSNNNEICEICHQKYSKSGNVLQPIWKWRKPKIEMTVIVYHSFITI